MVSAFLTPDDQIKSEKAGASFYFNKPLRVVPLAKALQKF